MKAFLRGFKYAAKGIYVALREERNLRLHLCIAFYVYLFSLFYSFGRQEYALLTVVVAGVISLEIINSALERAVQNPPPGRYMLAGIVKDMAAGAVLVFSIAAFVCGFLLFWDIPTFKVIFLFFKARLWLLFLLAVSLAAGCWFVFIFGKKKEKRKKT